MKLTLKYDYWVDLELQYYLLTINGINKVNIDIDKDEIYVEYDSSLISIKLILMEIDLFLETTGTPYLIAFNKHNDNYLLDYEIVIKDLCCEYCLKSNIEELLLIN